MYSKIIKYTDYNGITKKKECLFNMNKAEIIKWVTTTGDYTIDKLLERLIKVRNGKEIIKIFEDLISMSYGEKSLDGDRFIKSEEITKSFTETEAYSVLFMELISDAKKAVEFIKGIIPKDMSDEITKAMLKNPEGIPDSLKDYVDNLFGDGSSDQNKDT